MKYSLYVFLLFILLGCTASKDISQRKKYTEFKVVNVPLTVENDTVFINELRFLKIYSATDGIKLMRQNYGKWDQKVRGKHQPNIKRSIWKNIKLINGDDTTFTVIADGTESRQGYFACLIVFDAKEKDCFSAQHPYKEKLIALFTEKMSIYYKKSSVYRPYR